MTDYKISRVNNGVKFLMKIGLKLSSNINTISSTNNPKRKGWAEAFQEMAKNGDDELVIEDVFEDEEFED